MRILYNNIVESSTISVFSENPAYLFDTALNDTRLSRYGQTVDDTAEWIKFSLASAQAASYIVIQNHNLTAGATVTLEANTTDSWGSPAFSQALTIDDIIIQDFTESSYQYWRITIADASNPDTYIKIGHIFLGTYLQMPGMSPDQIVPRKSNSVATKSVSGQVYGDSRLNYKAAEVNFPLITEAEKSSIDTFFNVVDVVKPFILLIWESDLTVEPPIYCSLTDELKWQKVASSGGLNWTLKLSFEEAF